MESKSCTVDAKSCVDYLRTLSDWDLKRVLCNVFDVDYMDDAGLRNRLERIANER